MSQGVLAEWQKAAVNVLGGPKALQNVDAFHEKVRHSLIKELGISAESPRRRRMRHSSMEQDGRAR